MKGSDSTITAKAKGLLSNVRLHWNEPAEGRYMPFKEILAYAGGGIGVKFLAVMAVNMILSTTNVLIGNTIGIAPMDMYVLYVLSVLSNIPLSGIRANIIDNTRSKEGKYRPYIIKAGIPSALITILFVWFPYDRLESIVGAGSIFGKARAYVATCVVVLLLNFAQQFFYNFFYEAYDNLLHVLSPNSQERTDVASVKGVVYSLAPSILGLIMPLFAQWFTNNNMYDIRLYRYLYPPLCILSIGLCIVIYANTKEKIVQAKTHIIQIKFMDSLREVVRNKYFWIIALAGWLGFLESAVSTLLQWLYNYGGVCTGTEYSIITLFCQNAGLVGMLLAPFCIRKWGKRGVLIMTNVLNVIFILLMYPFMNSLILLVVCFWMNALANAFAQILTPTIQADIRDYQQYVSGERIDGMFSTITALGGIVTLATSSVLPFIYETFGINETMARQVMNNSAIMNRVMDNGSVVGEVIGKALENGSANISYFSLYDPAILASMLKVLILVSVAGAVINVIPYFFYDLTELKQQGIIKVLKIRAFFEDYGNGTLSDRDLVEVVDFIETANQLAGEEPLPLTHSEIKHARKAKDQVALIQAKHAYREIENRNTEIALASYVLKELHRFDSPLGKLQVENAGKIVRAGLQGLERVSIKELKSELKAAKRLSKKTEEEKEIRQYAIHFYRTRLTARKYQKKYYDGKEAVLRRPDDSHLNELFRMEALYDEQEEMLYKKLYEARESRDSNAVKLVKAEIKQLMKQIKKLNKAIRDEQNKRTFYNRAAKPWLDASRLLKQAENYAHFSEIKDRYADAKQKIAAPSTV